jgi:hypothetical protein
MVKDGKMLAVSDLPGPQTRVMLADEAGWPVALAEPQDRDGTWRWAILRGLNPAGETPTAIVPEQD